MLAAMLDDSHPVAQMRERARVAALFQPRRAIGKRLLYERDNLFLRCVSLRIIGKAFCALAQRRVRCEIIRACYVYQNLSECSDFVIRTITVFVRRPVLGHGSYPAPDIVPLPQKHLLRPWRLLRSLLS